MSCTHSSAVIEALQWRYAVKQFDPAKRIDDALWADLEKSLVLTPSSFGLQPWRFLVIDNMELREQLVPHSWNQRQVADASHLVIMTVKTSIDEAYCDQFLAHVASERGIPVASLAGYRSMLIGSLPAMTQDWAARQAYIALGQFMLAAAMVGVDTCPMEGFSIAEYNRILGLEGSGFSTCVLCPAGYRASTDAYAAARKVRWPHEDVVVHRA